MNDDTSFMGQGDGLDVSGQFLTGKTIRHGRSKDESDLNSKNMFQINSGHKNPNLMVEEFTMLWSKKQEVSHDTARIPFL